MTSEDSAVCPSLQLHVVSSLSINECHNTVYVVIYAPPPLYFWLLKFQPRFVFQCLPHQKKAALPQVFSAD